MNSVLYSISSFATAILLLLLLSFVSVVIPLALCSCYPSFQMFVEVGRTERGGHADKHAQKTRRGSGTKPSRRSTWHYHSSKVDGE